MMSKYINAEDIITLPVLPETYRKSNTYEDGWKDLQKVIDNTPGVDVAEVKHGEWERIESGTSVHFRCSVCHRYRFHNGEMLRKYKFCPNCGADMRERKETE